MTRIVPTLAVSALVGVLGIVAASASPGPPYGVILGDRGWTPGTRHWDHYFHTPSQYDAPSEVGRFSRERAYGYGPRRAPSTAGYGPAPVYAPY